MREIKSKTKLEKIVYKSDASQISGEVAEVIFPKTAEEIVEIVKTKQNIVPRGGGTGLVGGAVPLNSTIVDLSKMDKILNIDKENKVAEVETGVILENLNIELARFGLEFPIDPSSAKSCTIGGMIACNAVGKRAVNYGRTSDWIKEIELINGKGEIIKLGKLNISDVAGFEGLTGIILKAKLNLSHLKIRTLNLLKINNIEKIPEIIKNLKLNKEVCGIEILDKITSRILGLPEIYHLIVEYESDVGEFKGEKYKKIMDLRDSAYPKLAQEGFTHIEDPKVLMFKLPQIIHYLEKNKIPFFGHIGVGIIHPCFKPEQKKEIEDLLNYVKKLSGQITGEHGIGLLKKKFIEPNDKRLFLNIKKRYDPEFKLNPSKIIDKNNEQTIN